MPIRNPLLRDVATTRAATGPSPLSRMPAPSIQGAVVRGTGSGMSLIRPPGYQQVVDEQRRRQESDPGWGQRVAHTIAGAVEPLFFLQDMMFGVLAGAFDPDTTIMERLRGDRGFLANLATYAPFGEKPERPATGEEIARLVFGLEDERAVRYTGIGLEFLADPILFGSYLRVAGRIGRSEQLSNIGRRLDQAVMPHTYMVGGARGAWRVLGRSMDEDIEKVLSQLRHPDGRLFGISGDRVMQVAEGILPKTVTERMRFGGRRAGPDLPVEGLGPELSAARRQLEADTEVSRAIGTARLHDIEALLIGDAPKLTMFQRLMSLVSDKYRVTNRLMRKDIPDSLKNVIMTQARQVWDNVGVGFSDPRFLDRLAEIEARVAARHGVTTRRNLGRSVERRALETGMIYSAPHKRLVRDLHVSEAKDRIVTEAKRVGMDLGDIDVLLKQFDEATAMAARLDVGLGLEATNYVKLKESFLEAIMRHATPDIQRPFDFAQDLWMQTLHRVNRGESVSNMSDVWLRAGRHERVSRERLADMRRAFADIGRYAGDGEMHLLALSRSRGITRNDGFLTDAGYQQLRRDASDWQTSADAYERWSGAWLEARAEMLHSRGDLRHALEIAKQGKKEAPAALKKEFSAILAKIEDTVNAAQKRMFVPLSELFDGALIAERKQRRRTRGQGFTEQAERRRDLTGDPDDPFSVTIGDLLAPESIESIFEIDKAIRAFYSGHLRRSYTPMFDSTGLARHRDNVIHGRTVLNSMWSPELVDTLNVSSPVKNAIRNVTSQFERTALDGTILRHANISKHDFLESLASELMRGGMSRREAYRQASRGYGEMVAARHNNDYFKQAVRDIMDFHDSFASRVASDDRSALAVAGQGIGTRYAAPRDQLTEPMLEALGEIMNPLITLDQSVRHLSGKIARRNYLARVREAGERHGYVVPLGRARGEFGNRPLYTSPDGVAYEALIGQSSVYGRLGDSFVHPQLKREIDRTLARFDKPEIGGAFARVRSLITGAYLASPNVVFANFMGGFWQSLMGGTPPVALIKNIFSEAEPLARKLNDPRYKYDIADELLQYGVDIIGSGLIAQNFSRAFKRRAAQTLGLEDGIVPSFFRNASEIFADFLQRPFGQKWAGLDGFQFVEVIYKAATYKHWRGEYLRRFPNNPEYAKRAAAERARLSVFDYADIPYGIEWVRERGLFMFPGFTYFMTSRMASAILKRPAVAVTGDKISEQITNAVVDPDMRAAAWASLPDWMKEEQGTYVYVGQNKAGDHIGTVLPLNQLIPTNTLALRPGILGTLGDSMFNLGIFAPLFETAYALFEDDGGAIFSARYGRRVFDQHTSGIERGGQVAWFLATGYAPGIVRHLINMGDVWKNSGVPVSPEFSDTPYSVTEIMSRRPDQTIYDRFVAMLTRSPLKVGLTGPLNFIRREVDAAKRDRSAALSALRGQLRSEVAAHGPGSEAAQEIRVRMEVINADYLARVQELMRAYRQMHGRENR